MKRLILCFDGTWNGRAGAPSSNIGRLANCLKTVQDPDGTQQVVLYVPGVGANYAVDRFFGGALGLGLRQNVMTGYKFITANYDEGDQVFLFGFSRGAYTARSLASMLTFPGLLRATPSNDTFDYVQKLYSSISEAQRCGQEPRQVEIPDFRPAGHFQPQTVTFEHAREDLRPNLIDGAVDIRFVGVFDTVGALGPGAAHNLFLSPLVRTARHALALDEHRLEFQPLLWTIPDPEAEPFLHLNDNQALPNPNLRDPERVRQVWFQGAHSDVGGGAVDKRHRGRSCIGPSPAATYNSLANTTLLWMLAEAHRREGLEVNLDVLEGELGLLSTESDTHPSLNLFYRFIEVRRHLSNLFHRNPSFKGRTRILEPDKAMNVRIASSVIARRERKTKPDGTAGTYDPESLQLYEQHHGDVADVIEQVKWLPGDAARMSGDGRQLIDELFAPQGDREFPNGHGVRAEHVRGVAPKTPLHPTTGAAPSRAHPEQPSVASQVESLGDGR